MSLWHKRASDPGELHIHRLATVALGPRNLFVINDLKLAKELFDREELTKRDITEWTEHLFLLNGKIRQAGFHLIHDIKRLTHQRNSG